jgi:hypothetical protein
VSVAVSSGSSPLVDRKPFCVPLVGLRRFRLSTPNAVNAYPGMEVLQLMTSPLLMRMGNRFSLVSGVAVILIVSIHLI